MHPQQYIHTGERSRPAYRSTAKSTGGSTHRSTGRSTDGSASQSSSQDGSTARSVSQDKDLKVNYNPSLLWCHFRLRPQLEERMGTCEELVTRLQEAFIRPQTCDWWVIPFKSSARRKIVSAYSNLQVYKNLHKSTRIYKTHHITDTSIHTSGEWPKVSKRNRVSNTRVVCSNFQAMLLHLEHPALPMGNPVAPSLHGKGTTSVTLLTVPKV